MIYQIHERNLAQLQLQVTKLTRRALRLKLPPITLTIGQHTNVPHPDNANELLRVFAVEVTGDTPRINGWSFVASILHDEGNNVVRKVQGETLPDDIHTRSSMCEHCNVNRRRNCTFLLRHEAGELKQVGSTCLRDFLGHTSPHDLASWAEQALNISDLCDAATGLHWLGGGTTFVRMSLPVFLNQVAEQAIRYGFKGKKDVGLGEKTTAMYALDMLFPGLASGVKPVEIFTPSDEAVALAEKAREWALRRFRDDGDMATVGDYDDIKLELLTEPNDGLSEFQLIVLAMARHEVITKRSYSLAAWIVGSYMRHEERKRVNAAIAKTSKHVGEVKKRMTLELFYYDFKEWNTVFGSKTLYKFRDATGNQLTWETGASACLELNSTYTVVATVKEHDTYNGIAQTKLTRCKTTKLPK